MSAELKPDLQLQIAHLLLIDVVGYSKLLVNEQIELIYELNRVVRSSECFRAAEAKDKLIRLPTGDGMALLFFENPEQPVHCALEIYQALKDHPEIRVRMGIHSGPVNQVADVNDRVNIAGAGINVAQRVLDCGDAGHILLSKHLADDLMQYRHWSPHLRDLGECEVKHGLRLHVFNLCKDGAGNPNVPEKLKARRWKLAAPSVRPISSKTRQWLRAGALVMVLVLLGVTMSILWQRRAASRASLNAPPPIPEKSIAVMPFENLSDDKQNAYFADGVQDEILTNLAKVADLKVISRTSVMRYKDVMQRNVREIGKLLGVSHILEGSVQRSGNRIRLTAQLIDARTDAHVWAERYDRDLADVFALENELSEQIVAQLKSRLSPNEKAAIEEQPTSNLGAYDLYTRAKLLIERAVFTEPREPMLTEAVQLLEQATQRDPKFLLAFYQLAHAHDQFYWVGLDRTPERLAKSDAAIKVLQRLAPDTGETHLALAKHLYWGYLDYDRARIELERARALLPNDPSPLLLTSYIDRRQGRWEESLRGMQRALALDPRNSLVLQQLGFSYSFLRRYREMAEVLDRALDIAPSDPSIRIERALVDLQSRADTKPLRALIDSLVRGDATRNAVIYERWFELSLFERNVDSAMQALATMGATGTAIEAVEFPHGWAEGLVARLRNDKNAARIAFLSARAQAAQTVQQDPANGPALGALAMIDAALGNKKESIREGKHALELLPVSKDAVDGALLTEYLAVIYGCANKTEAAFQYLFAAAQLPGHLNYGNLKLDPLWDPLRQDPRFEKILASLAPKS